MIMSFCNILQQLILADVADQIQIKSGQRVEGTLAASTGFAQKLGGALGGMLGALYLSFIGYVPDAVQTQPASMGIRILATIVPAAAMAITALLYFKVYAITQEREKDIKQQILLVRQEAENTNEGGQG
jgi:Na+/melibiose symporter-like transporter